MTPKDCAVIGTGKIGRAIGGNTAITAVKAANKAIKVMSRVVMGSPPQSAGLDRLHSFGAE